MIGYLVPRGRGGDWVDDLYGTGVCPSQNVVHYGMDGMRAKALKNLQKTGSIRESDTRNSGERPTSCPPEAVRVVDGDIFWKEAVRDRPRLGEVKFCALPKRQYRVQPMINGSKDGGKNGEGAACGAKGMIPMNFVVRGSRVQKGRVPFRTGTLAGHGGRPDADG